MKVLIVCNNIYGKGNGLATSARTTSALLKKAGADVRVMSMRNQDESGPQPDYPLEKFHFPFFQWLIEIFGYSFPKNDRVMIREALEWCDVVHLEEAFPLEWITANKAVKMGKPRVATFHLYPENITYQIGMKNWGFLNRMLLRIFRNVVYDKCSHVQCPTDNVRCRLEKYHFKAKLHVISNGIALDNDSGRDHQSVQTEPFLITSVGRFSNEKDQFTLLRAMKYSKHADHIQLYFAGRGPKEKKIRRMSEDLCREGVLKYPPQFAFHTMDELRDLARRAYLNVHCATIEVEGLSCLEFIREGAVPVIAQAELSATSQFALDSRSVFPAKDPRTLAQRIDWWIEHPEEREAMSLKYAESAVKYEISKSIDALLGIYDLAMEENR